MEYVNNNLSRKLGTIFKPPSAQFGLEERNKRWQSRIIRSTEHITPLDFDNFIPWVCKQWSLSQIVTVVRIYQENEKSELSKSKEVIEERVDKLTNSRKPKIVNTGSSVTIEANYNANNHLETVTIDGCRVDIPKKVIRAINLCLPFHPALNRLNIRKGGVSEDLIREIGKLIPCSNITIICLDDSAVPDAKYDMLLKETSQLTYISLNRCKIKDDVCKEIAMNLAVGNKAAKSLNILELAGNNITDEGAQFFGTMLRSNRQLLHLNLADNKITDDGAKALFKPLMEFELTDEEVIEMKRRRYTYLQNKQAAFDKYLEHELRTQELREQDLREQKLQEQVLQQKESQIKESRKKQVREKENKSPNRNKSSKKDKVVSKSSSNQNTSAVPSFNSISPHDRAQQMTDKIVGEFIDPYSTTNIEWRDERCYAKGNLILCSVNIAYNSLRHPSLKTLDSILFYQHCIKKTPPATGMIRIVLDGNELPECDELRQIEFYLNFKVAQNVPVRTAAEKAGKSCITLKKRRDKSTSKIESLRESV